MPALCSCRIFLLPSDLQAHVFNFRTDVIQSHGQLTVRCHENKARTQCQHEPFRKSGKLSRGLSYPAGPRFPPGGVAQPLKTEARPGFSVGSPRGGRCQPSERGAAEASRGLLECMS